MVCIQGIHILDYAYAQSLFTDFGARETKSQNSLYWGVLNGYR